MSDAPSHHPPGYRPPHPSVYFLLFLPFGATNAFLVTTIGTLARDAKISNTAIAGLLAVNILPHTWKFIWAPLVDTLWTTRGWYITTNLISSAAIIVLGFIPITEANLGLMSAVIFVNGLATTFVGMCTEALMARLCTPDQRGAAGGWSQAANVGGGTLGGFGVIIAEHAEPTWLPGVTIGVALMACSLGLLLVKEPPEYAPRPGVVESFKLLGKDIWNLLFDRERVARVPSKWLFGLPVVGIPVLLLWALSAAGILSIVLCLVPIGSGGAQNLFGAMGEEWGASKDLIGFANGMFAGVAAIVGSLAGGFLSDKIDKRWAYAVSGLTLAIVAFLMAATPQWPVFYVGGTMLYSFALGMCYATFTAFVLDIIGHTGGATKYNLFATAANVPIIIMALVDGGAADDYGYQSMLVVDGLAGVGGATVLMGVVFLLRYLRPKARISAD